ncbi:anti-sigma factor [Demequina activiva]|uniref:Regulator of SigK n=1 Tax=Demequina activiva TaxID=1582364 RepID=A0A919UK31_9MICO|nr:anti-sigma factor [Demequina activiva]GIG53308.1 hypothetical protein Dac01nite_00600 [Demequina activiva]
MTDSIHSLVPAYAVDALEPDERAMVERHLRECTDCREDLAAFRAATAALADAEAAAPPLSLRSRVMAEVARTSQLTPDAAEAPSTDPIRVAATFDSPGGAGHEEGSSAAAAAHARDDDLAGRRDRRGVRRWMPALAGAAATVAVAAVGLGMAGAFSADDAATEVALEKDVMMVTSAPDATSMDVDLGNGHLVKSDRMDAFVLMGAAAPMPDKGTEYQLWLIMEDGSKVAGPTFMPEDDGEYMTVMHGDMDGVVAVAVTCEPPGGSDEPTTEAVSEVIL